MLRLENLAKLYGLKVVFKGVSCRFTAGSITLLAGGNGAGKSTLLRIVAGLSRPSAGEVVFDGTGAGGVAREDGPRLAYLGHATFVYPGLSALENLQFWARAHGLRPSRAELLALLEHVGLAAHAEERAGVFSRGMAQRLNLARVLLLDAAPGPWTSLPWPWCGARCWPPGSAGPASSWSATIWRATAPWPTACCCWRTAAWPMTGRRRGLPPWIPCSTRPRGA